MAKQPTCIGIDLGASKIAVAVVTLTPEGQYKILGAGMRSPDGGIKQGAINDMGPTVEALKTATEDALLQAGMRKSDAVAISVDSSYFKGENLRDSIAINSKDKVVTNQDINRVLDQAETNCKLAKQDSVLHRIAQTYHIQGQQNIRNPLHMVSNTLEAEVRLILAPQTVLGNVIRSAQMAGFDPKKIKLLYSPLATAEAVIPRKDLENAAVTIDIGEELTHVGIFQSETLYHSAFIPIGGRHFTRDLEITKNLGGMAAAENIKKRYGAVDPQQVGDEIIELESEGRGVSRSAVAEVLQARALELFDFIRGEINRTNITEFHGGIHLVGGGSLLYQLPGLAQKYFGRSRVGISRPIEFEDALADVLHNPYFVNVLGAAKYQLREMKESGTEGGIFRKFFDAFA